MGTTGVTSCRIREGSESCSPSLLVSGSCCWLKRAGGGGCREDCMLRSMEVLSRFSRLSVASSIMVLTADRKSADCSSPDVFVSVPPVALWEIGV